MEAAGLLGDGNVYPVPEKLDGSEKMMGMKFESYSKIFVERAQRSAAQRSAARFKFVKTEKEETNETSTTVLSRKSQ